MCVSSQNYDSQRKDGRTYTPPEHHSPRGLTVFDWQCDWGVGLAYSVEMNDHQDKSVDDELDPVDLPSKPRGVPRDAAKGSGG